MSKGAISSKAAGSVKAQKEREEDITKLPLEKEIGRRLFVINQRDWKYRTPQQDKSLLRLIQLLT